MKEPVAHTARGSIFAAFVGTSLSSVLVTALTFVSGVLIARALGPEGRGDYGAVLLVASTAAALGCLSFFDASVAVPADCPAVMLQLQTQLGSEALSGLRGQMSFDAFRLLASQGGP